MTERGPAEEDILGLEAAEQEFLAFGWERAHFPVPGSAEPASDPTRPLEASGFRRGDFAAYRGPLGWEVVALPAGLLLGGLPSVSAVRRFAQKCVSFPAQPNGAVIGAARQAMLQAVEEELHLARQAAQSLENKIDDLMASIDDIRAKAILFGRSEED